MKRKQFIKRNDSRELKSQPHKIEIIIFLLSHMHIQGPNEVSVFGFHGSGYFLT